MYTDVRTGYAQEVCVCVSLIRVFGLDIYVCVCVCAQVFGALEKYVCFVEVCVCVVSSD